MSGPPLLVRRLGLLPYEQTAAAMRTFTTRRTAATPCELWLLEHPPVFTLGQAGRFDHLHQAGDIPVIRSDRGGQITYHGPGQLVAYTLFDLHRLGIGIRSLVQTLEQAIIDVLATDSPDRFQKALDVTRPLKAGFTSARAEANELEANGHIPRLNFDSGANVAFA